MLSVKMRPAINDVFIYVYLKLELIGNRLFRYRNKKDRSKVRSYSVFSLYVCLCVCVCIRALYRSHRLTDGAEIFTTIPVNIP